VKIRRGKGSRLRNSFSIEKKQAEGLGVGENEKWKVLLLILQS
jgi:hypothetical protein